MRWTIVAPPAKDVFPFLVDLQSYPSQLFSLAMTVGLYSVRRQHRGETPIYKAWDAAIIFYAIVSVFLLVTPWLVPAGGIYGGDVSFLWCTYIIVGIGLIFICGAYYVVWMKVLPRVFNYRYEVDVSVLSLSSVYVPTDDITPSDYHATRRQCAKSATQGEVGVGFFFRFF